MHQITDDIRQQLNIPRYDINDDTSLSMTKNSQPVQNGLDDDLEKYIKQNRNKHVNQGPMDMEADIGLSNTLEFESLKSKTSKVSTEPSADTYNFKSTEDDDVYSTIRSDMNNTTNLTDTLALRTYQASINEQEELEEGEIPPESVGTVEPGSKVTVREIHDVSGRDEDDGGDDYEDDDDDYGDDDYEDDGDDEQDEDGHHTTEPTATYRTDDDDDF